MQKLKLYLAGPITGWRENAFSELKDHFEVYDPIQHSRQHSQSEYVPDDLAATKQCQIILAYQPKDKQPNLSMAIEATHGYCHGAMVIYIDERGTPDPLLIGISKRFFSNMDEAILFLKKISVDPAAQGMDALRETQ